MSRGPGRALRLGGVAALAFALLAVLLRDRLGALRPGAFATGPETQVKESLRARGGARLAVPGGPPAVLERLAFSDVTVLAEGGAANALAIVDAEGRVPAPGGEAALSYVGREAIQLDRCGPGRWCPEEPLLPALAGVLEVLRRRAEAFDRGDAAAYAALVSDRFAGPGGKPALLERLRADLGASPRARLSVRAWQVRVERDRAEAGEDAEVTVGGGAPARVRGRYVLLLTRDGWRISEGL